MIIEIKIEIPNEKSLLFSYHLSFIKPEPDHPRFLRLIYDVETKRLKLDGLFMEQKNIIILERQQDIKEVCNGWKRTLSIYRMDKPKSYDKLFYDNNGGKVRMFKSSETRGWDPVDSDYAYKLEKLDEEEKETPVYKSMDPEFYGPEDSEISSPRTMSQSPELMSFSSNDHSIRSIDAQGTDGVSTIGSVRQDSCGTSSRGSIITNQSGSHQPDSKKMKYEEGKYIKDDEVDVLDHFKWKKPGTENILLDEDSGNNEQHKIWTAADRADNLELHLTTPKIVTEKAPILIFFPEKGRSNFQQNQEDMTGKDGIKFISEFFYVLSIQEEKEGKWTKYFDKRRIDLIMTGITKKFDKDRVTIMGTSRGAFQAILTYLDNPDSSRFIILNNPYLNTQTRSKVNGTLKTKLYNGIKYQDTYFHIGISNEKNIQERALEIIKVMNENKTSMYSKFYESTKEMIQEQLGDITEMSAVGKLMDKYVDEMKIVLEGSELEKLKHFEKLRKNINNPDVTEADE